MAADGDKSVAVNIEGVDQVDKAPANNNSSLLASSTSGGGYGLSISGLATYMPTGTTAAFVVLTQLVADGGQCKHTTDTAGNFLKAHDKAEVTLMVLVIWLLGIACFASAFVKTTYDPQVPGHVTYSRVTKDQLRGKGPLSRHKDGSLRWCAGWKLWVHAIFSTLAYATWSLTSASATSCFYNLPAAVSRSLSPIVAVICAIAFAFLGPPTIEDQVTSIPKINQESVQTIKSAFRVAEIILDERVLNEEQPPAKSSSKAEVPVANAGPVVVKPSNASIVRS